MASSDGAAALKLDFGATTTTGSAGTAARGGRGRLRLAPQPATLTGPESTGFSNIGGARPRFGPDICWTSWRRRDSDGELHTWERPGALLRVLQGRHGTDARETRGMDAAGAALRAAGAQAKAVGPGTRASAPHARTSGGNGARRRLSGCEDRSELTPARPGHIL